MRLALQVHLDCAHHWSADAYLPRKLYHQRHQQRQHPDRSDARDVLPSAHVCALSSHLSQLE